MTNKQTKSKVNEISCKDEERNYCSHKCLIAVYSWKSKFLLHYIRYLEILIKIADGAKNIEYLCEISKNLDRMHLEHKADIVAIGREMHESEDPKWNNLIFIFIKRKSQIKVLNLTLHSMIQGDGNYCDNSLPLSHLPIAHKKAAMYFNKYNQSRKGFQNFREIG